MRDGSRGNGTERYAGSWFICICTHTFLGSWSLREYPPQRCESHCQSKQFRTKIGNPHAAEHSYSVHCHSTWALTRSFDAFQRYTIILYTCHSRFIIQNLNSLFRILYATDPKSQYHTLAMQITFDLECVQTECIAFFCRHASVKINKEYSHIPRPIYIFQLKVFRSIALKCTRFHAYACGYFDALRCVCFSVLRMRQFYVINLFALKLTQRVTYIWRCLYPLIIGAFQCSRCFKCSWLKLGNNLKRHSPDDAQVIASWNISNRLIVVVSLASIFSSNIQVSLHRYNPSRVSLCSTNFLTFNFISSCLIVSAVQIN